MRDVEVYDILTNGWSSSKRNNPYANCGIVVTDEEEDWSACAKYDEVAALKFQEDVEHRMFPSVLKNAGSKLLLNGWLTL
ncbi:MAG: hypothetical protein QMC40_07585 [Vicingaceae bacterium]|jgi:uncharacterized FAD-dependent dehydrogenase|tara:strand:+ start:500 stop:739 length:240 start_codon:yes stop_codon:yes gene_type:complete